MNPRLGLQQADALRQLLIGLIQTPYRFRSKRQLWAYCLDLLLCL